MALPSSHEASRGESSGLHRVSALLARDAGRTARAPAIDSPWRARRLAALFALSVVAAAVAGYVAGRLATAPGPGHEEHGIPHAGEAR